MLPIPTPIPRSAAAACAGVDRALADVRDSALFACLREGLCGGGAEAPTFSRVLLLGLGPVCATAPSAASSRYQLALGLLIAREFCAGEGRRASGWGQSQPDRPGFL